MKTSYVKVMKKIVEGEGGKEMENDYLQRKGKESDYVQMSRKRSGLEEVVIYTKEIKEKKES